MKKVRWNGSFYAIEMPSCHLVFRTAYEPVIIIYDYKFPDKASIDTSLIKNVSPILFLPVHKSLFSDRRVTFLSYLEFSADDMVLVPPQFWQDVVDQNNCKLLYADGSVKEVMPQECIGIEPIGAYDSDHVLSRIESFFKGEPNAYYELVKVKVPQQ